MPESDTQKEPMVMASGLLNGMPMWAKVISYLGFPIALCIGLLYFIFSLMQPHMTETNSHHETMTKALEDIVYVNQVNCQNNATINHLDPTKCMKPPGP